MYVNKQSILIDLCFEFFQNQKPRHNM